MRPISIAGAANHPIGSPHLFAHGRPAISNHTDRIAERLGEAQAGSSQALGEVLQATRRYLLWVARQEMDADLRPKAGASDLVQDTLLEAHRDFGQFQGKSEAELLAWLRRLLLNNLANFARTYRGTAKRDVNREFSLAAEGAPEPPAARQPTPSQILMAREQDARVRRALARLPEDYRRILTLCDQENMTFAAMGELMGRSPNAARMLWARALERLEQELQRG